MSFVDSIKTCFDKILTIDGRAARSEFWYFILFQAVITAVVSFLFRDYNIVLTAVGFILALARLTVSIRRLHDIGKSGWWMLLSAVPVIGWIVLLVFALMDSQPGTNQYGPNPKSLSFA